MLDENTKKRSAASHPTPLPEKTIVRIFFSLSKHGLIVTSVGGNDQLAVYEREGAETEMRRMG